MPNVADRPEKANSIIREILRRIYRVETLNEISHALDMDYSALIGMIEQLTKMGFLIAIKKDDEKLSTCRICPLYKVCSKKDLKIYSLTERGKKLIGVK